MGLFNVGHVAKLNEIQEARLRAGQEGIGAEVEDLIRRLEMGGVNQWRIHAKRLWDRGFGRDKAVKAKNFRDYLQGIPKIPASLLAQDSDLSLLSLADPRPGLLRSCRLLRIKYEKLGCADGDVGPFDDRFVLPTAPFWFRHDGGMENRKRRPDHCRDEATGLVLVGTAMEGLFAYAHHLDIVKEGQHALDLPGTVCHPERVDCAFLRVWSRQARLGLYRCSGFASPDYGALRVRRK